MGFCHGGNRELNSAKGTTKLLILHLRKALFKYTKWGEIAVDPAVTKQPIRAPIDRDRFCFEYSGFILPQIFCFIVDISLHELI